MDRLAEVPALSTENEAAEKKKPKRRWWIRCLSALCIAAIAAFAAALAWAWFRGGFRSVESMQAFFLRFGSFAPLALGVFQALQVIVPMFPGALGYVAGSMLFGPTVGFWCNYLGISCGSVAAFFLARRFGMPLLKELFPAGRYQKWSDWASRSKSYTVFLFLAMLLPLFPDDYLCYLTGVSKMTARRFFWIIVLGKPWCILAYCLGFSLIK